MIFGGTCLEESLQLLALKVLAETDHGRAKEQKSVKQQAASLAGGSLIHTVQPDAGPQQRTEMRRPFAHPY